MAHLLEQRPDTIRDLLGGTSVLLVTGLAEDTVNTLVCSSQLYSCCRLRLEVFAEL
jgi:hypothetical protein